jgi:glutamine amidotransferase
VSHIVVLDYGSGNVRSAQRALETTGATVEVSRDHATALEADGLVVPGVGAFGACIDALREVHGDAIIARRLAGGRPVLGICVGMQVLFDSSDEYSDGSTSRGMGEWPGMVQELDAPVLPHMGWNTVSAPPDSAMFDGIRDEYFYFVHSYAVTHWVMPVGKHMSAPPVTWAHYGQQFVAAVENGPLWATQFHPEKSGEAGLALLKNWVSTIG